MREVQDCCNICKVYEKETKETRNKSYYNLLAFHALSKHCFHYINMHKIYIKKQIKNPQICLATDCIVNQLKAFQSAEVKTNKTKETVWNTQIIIIITETNWNVFSYHLQRRIVIPSYFSYYCRGAK